MSKSNRGQSVIGEGLPETGQLAVQLEEDVVELCRPQGRVVGSDGHFDAEIFVQHRLSECGCVPYGFRVARPAGGGRALRHVRYR